MNRVTSMAVQELDGEVHVSLEVTRDGHEGARWRRFVFGGADASALAHAMSRCGPYHELDLDRMRAEGDALTGALAILEAE